MSIEEKIKVEPPPLLCKYAGHWAENFFKDPTLHFSSPILFNDPFEFFPSLELKVNRKDRDQICDYHKIPRTTSVKQIETRLGRIIHNKIASNMAVFCMAQRPDNILMWAHYAKSHEGCVLGLDSDLIRAFYYKNCPDYAGKIQYIEKKHKSPYPQQNIREENLQLVFCKAKDWAYESEWRIALRKEFSAGETRRIVNFVPDLLRYVIIGCRAAEAGMEDKYRRAIRENKKFHHVRIYRAEKHPQNYQLIIRSENGDEIDWDRKMIEYSEQKSKSPKASWYQEAENARRVKYGV